MKRIMFAISLMLVSILSTAQKETSKALKSDSTHLYLNTFNSQLEGMRKRQSVSDSTISALIDNQRKLEQENSILRTTIDANSNMFSGISTYFTIVSILLTIIIVLLPVVNYFLVWKPNQKAMKKVRNLETDVLKTMENNFEAHFEKLRKQKVVDTINLLEDRSKSSHVTNFLMLNDYGRLEEAQVKKILDFLASNRQMETVDVIVLNRIAIESRLLIAEKHYKNILENDDTANFKFAIGYLVEDDFESHLPYIAKIVSANPNGHNLLMEIFDYIEENYVGSYHNIKMPEKKEKGIMYSKLLFDNDGILKAIEGKPVPTKFRGQPVINRNRLNNNPYLRDTKYYETYLSSLDKKEA